VTQIKIPKARTRSETQTMRSSRRIKPTASSSAGMIPTTMELLDMAVKTRPESMRMSMSTRMASRSTRTIHRKAHSRGTRRANRTLRRLRRRNLMMSLCARAGTRSSLLPITGSLSGLTRPREILSSSHLSWESSRPLLMRQTRQVTSLFPQIFKWRRRQ
jgi:hypothetical protein